MEIERNHIYNMDCIEGMRYIPNQSIDLILTDLPYGTSASSWDKKIPMKELWAEYERIIKPNRAIVLFSQQPFTSLLITSNLKLWKYNWVWEKDNATNFLNSHYQPMKITEDICVFGTGATSYSKNENMIYNPQYEKGKPYTIVSGNQKDNSAVTRGVEGRKKVGGFKTENEGIRYPKNIIKFNRDKEKLHPTQKPVALIEYLIRTYSNKNEVVLDSCMGSGTTAIAALNTQRDYIGFELDKKYYDIIADRLIDYWREGDVVSEEQES